MNSNDFDAIKNEDESFDDAVERAGMCHAAKLLADPEWHTPKPYHIHTLINAIAYGIISSDSYFLGYILPPHFTVVMDRMISLLQSDPPGPGDCEVIKVSLVDMKIWLKKHLIADPHYVAWNDAAGSGFVSRNTPVATERQFIDLDCPPHNAVIYMRDDTRKFEAFDADFEARHGKAPE